MNCKPGDLAVVSRTDKRPEYIGRFLTVISKPPVGEFVLPNGKTHVAIDPEGRWIVEFQREVLVLTYSGKLRSTKFAVVRDETLKPIRDPGDDAIDETAFWNLKRVEA